MIPLQPANTMLRMSKRADMLLANQNKPTLNQGQKDRCNNICGPQHAPTRSRALFTSQSAKNDTCTREETCVISAGHHDDCTDRGKSENIHTVKK